jgi:hypothetical protein
LSFCFGTPILRASHHVPSAFEAYKDLELGLAGVQTAIKAAELSFFGKQRILWFWYWM